MQTWRVFQTKVMQKPRNRPLTLTTVGEDAFAVTEKIHGANLKFEVLHTPTPHHPSKLSVRVCSRRRLLSKDDAFFDYQTRILPKLEPKLKQLFWPVWMTNPRICSVAVYGEIFGGQYGHRDVEPTQGVRPVQHKHAHYSPDIHFSAFDVQYRTEKDKPTYLPFAWAFSLLRAVGVPTVPVILRNATYAQVCALDVETLATRAPARYGLPPIERNIAEGVVIRLMRDTYRYRGRRCIFKWKSAKFNEVRPRLYDHTPTIPQGDVDSVLQEVERYITKPRLASVLSKLDETARLNTARVCGMLVADALQDFFADDQNDQQVKAVVVLYRTLTPAVKKQVKKHLNAKAHAFFFSMRWKSP